ncbi:hypothetical protein BASA81_018599 [Batrachochytrium salamandrivorans]|nr:hypothetical protein BASA81_018599 [Batrachochytrium salamandrivorans]
MLLLARAFYIYKCVTLACIQTFFTSLIDPDANGRIIYSYNTDPELCTVKYLLLNPADCFEPILRQARSLLPSVPRDKIDVFTCGHVIKSTSLLPICVSRGPTGIEFNFSHEKRHSLEMIDERVLLWPITNVIPGGIVAFLSRIRTWSLWFADGAPREYGIVSQSGKRYFLSLHLLVRGPCSARLCWRNRSRRQTWWRMSMEKSKSKPNPFLTGSLLLAVVSGKLSEGLIFRIIWDVPFANIASTELQERMRFFDQKASSTGSNTTGREYYENMCMRAVNQSIGRSIRHKDDYATILFLDVRFKRDHIVKKLPEWIRSCGLVCPDQLVTPFHLLAKGLQSYE